jgi:hypothetical protein
MVLWHELPFSASVLGSPLFLGLEIHAFFAQAFINLAVLLNIAVLALRAQVFMLLSLNVPGAHPNLHMIPSCYAVNRDLLDSNY